jgi:hypothetical protein
MAIAGDIDAREGSAFASAARYRAVLPRTTRKETTRVGLVRRCSRAKLAISEGFDDDRLPWVPITARSLSPRLHNAPPPRGQPSKDLELGPGIGCAGELLMADRARRSRRARGSLC